MELAAYLDGQYVEMHIETDNGKTISIVCLRDSIFSVQRHIEKMGRECPEIATWQQTTNIKARDDNVHRSHQQASTERGHGSRGARPMLVGAGETNQAELQE